jgi:predicted nucleic acid-binding protein
MPVALLDTNVLFASASARDDYHNRAQQIVRGIDHSDLPDVMMTNSVMIRSGLNPAVRKSDKALLKAWM